MLPKVNLNMYFSIYIYIYRYTHAFLHTADVPFDYFYAVYRIKHNTLRLTGLLRIYYYDIIIYIQKTESILCWGFFFFL
jgi:hypothetical protein